MKAITFREYLEEEFAQDYTWCDDNMPEACEEWLKKLDVLDLEDRFDTFIRWDYVLWTEREKYDNFILNLLN